MVENSQNVEKLTGESENLTGEKNKYDVNINVARMCGTAGWPSLTAVPVWDHLWPRRATFFPPRMDHLFSVDHLFSTLYRDMGPPEIFGWWPPCGTGRRWEGRKRGSGYGRTDFRRQYAPKSCNVTPCPPPGPCNRSSSSHLRSAAIWYALP